jgi:hypothetical protein
LKILWEDTEVQRLLDEEQWNDVIILGDGPAHVSDVKLADFKLYGRRLIRKAQRRGAKPALIVNWNYGPEQAARIRKAMAGGPGVAVLCKEAEQ